MNISHKQFKRAKVWQAETPQSPTFRLRTPKARPFYNPKNKSYETIK